MTVWGFLDIWPPQDTFPWPARGLADDETLDRMNQAKTFVVQERGVQLSPFKPATEPTRQYDPSFLRPDLIEDDYFRFKNQPR